MGKQISNDRCHLSIQQTIKMFLRRSQNLCRHFSSLFMSPKLSVFHILIISLALGTCRTLTVRSSLMDPVRNSGPIVSTNYGRVKGLKHFLPSLSRTVDVFMGIPFAKPPVGHLRFTLPQPPDRWNYIYNATKIPNPCWQINDTFFGDDFRGSNMWNPLSHPNEDCLYLNVYVPKPVQLTTPTNSRSYSRPNKLAVMVWIYGGGFYSGSSYLDVYDGKYLAVTSDTIVVTVNYRLGALGFMTLKDPLAPPNVGLYDQLMSLEWVRHNIASFGGDPDNITIFGESAGAVSVSLHLLSPLSHDKFHRAIMQSGTANMPWAVVTMHEAQKRTAEFIKIIGCADQKEMEIVDVALSMNCMKRKSARAIVDFQWVTRNIMQFPFVPVVDGVFLPDDPIKLLERKEFKKCPILIGSNANEASFFIIYDLDSQFNLTHKSMNREDYAMSLNKLFFYYPQYPIEMPYRGLEAVKFQYTPWSDMDDQDKNINALDMAVSDSQFVCHVNTFARAYASAGQDVYAYYFTQRILNHVWPEWLGVLHGDEILFMFSEVTKWKNNYTFEEQELSKKMILYWSNFAKTGNPNTSPGLVSLDEWPLHSISHQEYLELNTKYLDSSNRWRAVGKGPRIRECAFWNTYLPNLLNEDHDNKKIYSCKPNNNNNDDNRQAPTSTISMATRHPILLATAVVCQILSALDCRWR